MKTSKCSAALYQIAHQLTQDSQEIEDSLFKGKDIKDIQNLIGKLAKGFAVLYGELNKIKET